MAQNKEQFPLPNSLRRWVESLDVIPVTHYPTVYPYSEYWWKCVAWIMLSGRVKPTWEKSLPNLTDVNRICKEANFNQYYFQNAAEVLVASEVFDRTLLGSYGPGKRFEDFWSRDLARLKSLGHHGLFKLIHRLTPAHSGREVPLFADAPGMLSGFFMALGEKALRADQIGAALRSFSELPYDDRISFINAMDIEYEDFEWEPWLADDKGQKAVIDALYTSGWAYTFTQDKHDWFSVTPQGRVFLDLEAAPPVPPEVTELKVLPDLTILAGIDLPVPTLVTLFRYCRIKHLDSVVQFILDKKTMRAMPAKTSSGEELLSVLQPCEPLPDTVRSLLGGQVKGGGKVYFRWCRGLVKVDDTALLDTLRTHPKLKSYVDRGGPPGYLIIKEGVNPDNFVQRCQEHGFEVKPF